MILGRYPRARTTHRAGATVILFSSRDRTRRARYRRQDIVVRHSESFYSVKGGGEVVEVCESVAKVSENVEVTNLVSGCLTLLRRPTYSNKSTY